MCVLEIFKGKDTGKSFEKQCFLLNNYLCAKVLLSGLRLLKNANHKLNLCNIFSDEESLGFFTFWPNFGKREHLLIWSDSGVYPSVHLSPLSKLS